MVGKHPEICNKLRGLGSVMAKLTLNGENVAKLYGMNILSNHCFIGRPVFTNPRCFNCGETQGELLPKK